MLSKGPCCIDTKDLETTAPFVSGLPPSLLQYVRDAINHTDTDVRPFHARERGFVVPVDAPSTITNKGSYRGEEENSPIGSAWRNKPRQPLPSPHRRTDNKPKHVKVLKRCSSAPLLTRRENGDADGQYWKSGRGSFFLS
ncbi:uncharacterized protein HKW66_Vig0116570 [Vigna angularis]|uniref:Uncharacterized protein n=1 Tax=Phaseolus angularis TaxID=3914 RepID=A0A8T0JVD3_PHAAN|nr:uncharacterized protein HKW66_Vig0116570 [Vigna angularis]